MRASQFADARNGYALVRFASAHREISSALLRAAKTNATRPWVRLAARRCDEIQQDRLTLAACDAATVVGIFAAGGCRAIWRIRYHQVEACGLDAWIFFWRRSALTAFTDLSWLIARFANHLGERRLDFNCDDFARAVESGDHD